MPVVPFPTPNASAADLHRAAAVARKLALGIRFKNRPADAVRYALTAPPFELAQALAADDVLSLVKIRRALAKAHRVRDLDEVRQLQPCLARLCARLTETARHHGVRGWHIVVVLGALLVHGPTPAFAGSSQCAEIRDHDRREACIAQTSGHSSECEGVRNADDRAECRARSG